jgi:hypothetical protein
LCTYKIRKKQKTSYGGTNQGNENHFDIEMKQEYNKQKKKRCAGCFASTTNCNS